MSDSFLSSDEYDEQAHQLYNEGRYDQALELLREGIGLYPNAAELQVGLAYAYMAREEYAWARRHFERALLLDHEHEDALAGMGETLLKLGQDRESLKVFGKILDLGYHDDHELMLQLGRALFREGHIADAQRFFEFAVTHHTDSAEAAACVGFSWHRLGHESQALYWLQRALELDPSYAEARIYLGNVLYDRGETDAALHQLGRTQPEEHYDDLALWRYIEMRKAAYRLPDDDPELFPWLARLAEITGEPDDIEMLLAEVEAKHPDGTVRDPNQLELFSALVADLPGMQRRPVHGGGDNHMVATLSGHLFGGTWEEIVRKMKEADVEWARGSLSDFMASVARKGQAETGIVIPVTDAEAFVRGSAEAGVLRIIQ